MKQCEVLMGYTAECYVMLELAKRGVFCNKLTQDMDFDLITDSSVRIEVKSARPSLSKSGNKKSRPSYYNHYAFMNINFRKEIIKRDRKCDIFVFVCFNKDLTIDKYYIVPKSVIGQRKLISAPAGIRKFKTETRSLIEPYKNRWELIEGCEFK